MTKEPKAIVDQDLINRVEKLEKVVRALVNSYNGQIQAAKVGAEPFGTTMATIEEL